MTDRDILPFAPEPPEDADIAQRLAALYATTPAPLADQAERCARAVRAQAMHQTARSTLGIPVTRWWWGAAAAAVLVTATTRPWRGSVATREADSAFVQAREAAALQGTVTNLDGASVRFDLRLPSAASEVAIVGDFNGWDETATPMARRGRDGTWSASIPLAPGRHTYAFVVDGETWIVDPMAPQVPDDGYGPANAVVVETPSKAEPR
jgi:hypothetical protein